MSFAAAIAAAQRVGRAATKPRDSTFVYRRGDDTVEINPGKGRSTFNVDSGQGVYVTVQAHDFLIETAELVLADEVTLPQRSDTILETTDTGATYTYEILELNGEPAWRYSDEYRQQLRVHAKLIGSA